GRREDQNKEVSGKTRQEKEGTKDWDIFKGWKTRAEAIAEAFSKVVRRCLSFQSETE
ncbi:hypothetical protein RUM43_014650, partial [Polyplax serrata]